MGLNADMKCEHETAAEKALAEKDYAKALQRVAMAAEFDLRLAEQPEGATALQYVEDAFGLIDIAVELKRKTRAKERGASQGAAAPTPSSTGDQSVCAMGNEHGWEHWTKNAHEHFLAMGAESSHHEFCPKDTLARCVRNPEMARAFTAATSRTRRRPSSLTLTRGA